MNSPKYREFDKEKLTRNKKYEPIQVKPSSTTKKVSYLHEIAWALVKINLEFIIIKNQ